MEWSADPTEAKSSLYALQTDAQTRFVENLLQHFGGFRPILRGRISTFSRP